MDKYQKYFEMLVERNEHVNLTAITNKIDVFTIHFEDSKAGAALLKNGSSVLDVGSGAGFPGMALAIERPDCKITLLEGRGKKCDFLKEVVTELGLSNVEIINGRAEELKSNGFDFVVSRAVARLPKLLKFCAPHVKRGGEILAWKTDIAEVAEAKREIKKFGLKFLGGLDYQVADAKRIIFRFLKE